MTIPRPVPSSSPETEALAAVVDIAAYRRDLEERRLLPWARQRVRETYPPGWGTWEYEACARRMAGMRDAHVTAGRHS